MAAQDESDDGRPRRQELRLRRGGQLIVGRLQTHGPANYQFRARPDPSYYLQILTSKGVQTLWGKDLERAILEGKTKPKAGELIGARRIARAAVTVTNRSLDSAGKVIAQTEHHTHRTKWVVERISFFAERAIMAKKLREEQLDINKTLKERPELKSTFLSIRAVEEHVKTHINNPEDRERVMAMLKGAMAASIHRGEPLPSVSLREKKKTEEPPSRPAAGEEKTR